MRDSGKRQRRRTVLGVRAMFASERYNLTLIAIKSKFMNNRVVKACLSGWVNARKPNLKLTDGFIYLSKSQFKAGLYSEGVFSWMRNSTSLA